MRNSTVVGRVAAIAAVLIAVIAVAVIVLGGGTSYKVNAIFQNASQIVTGDLVEVAGNGIGTVTGVALTPEGQANLELSITNPDYKPLRQGTTAAVRSVSLSGIANRYVDLNLGPGGASSIKDGGTIPTTQTTSEVDLDQLFNTLDAPTRKGLQNVIQGSASQYVGSAQAAQLAFQYLNPAIATSSLLFAEINRDTSKFTNFIVKSGNLVSDISQRSVDLSGLIGHLATTTQALAAQRASLGEAIQRLPGFMALADTTFVNLRNALDDLTPVVNATKPVAPKLQKLLAQLQPLAEDSVPTVRDLSNIISRPGPDNDLTELTALGVPLANATVHDVHANGKLRPGAFPVSTTSLNDTTPEIATLRPYAVDLTSWFDGFSHPGTQDGLGSASRTTTLIGGLTATQLSELSGLPLAQQLTTIPQLLTHGTTQGGGKLTAFQGDRCPGSLEPKRCGTRRADFPATRTRSRRGNG